MSYLVLSMVIGISLAGCTPKEETTEVKEDKVEDVKTVPLLDDKENYLSVS